LSPLKERLQLYSDYDEMVVALSKQLMSGDQLVFMSNGSFGSVRQKLTLILQKERQA